MPKKILILDNDNSVESQMLEGWVKYYSGNEAIVISAGLKANQVNMYAAKAMMDAVIDITGQTSKSFETLEIKSFDIILKCNSVEIPEELDATEYIEFMHDLSLENTNDEQIILQFYNKLRDYLEEYSFDFVNNYVRSLIPPEMIGLYKN